jgi:glycosyltransferase involved in cell wall biosynthesis
VAVDSEKSTRLRLHLFVDNHIQGGVDSHIRTLITRLREMNIEVHLILNLNYPNFDDVTRQLDGGHAVSTFTSVLQRPWFTGVNRGYRGARRSRFHNLLVWFAEFVVLIFEALRMKAKFGHLRDEHFLVVNGGYPGSPMSRAIVLAIGRRNKMFMSVHGLAPPRPFGLGIVEWAVDHLIARRVTRFICVSRTCAQRLISRLRVDASRIRVVLNAISPPSTTNSAGVNTLTQLGRQQKRLGLIGVVGEGKGHFFALEVMSQIEKLMGLNTPQLCFFGPDPYNLQATITERAIRLGINNHVSFMGMTQDKTEMYNSIDVVLIPSITPESFSLVAAEATYFGKRIIAFHSGALPETLAEVQTAMLLEHLDARTWAESVTLILRTVNSVQTNSEPHSQITRMFDPLAMATEYVDAIFEDVPI